MTHGNGLVTTVGYDLDYRLSLLNVNDGATSVSALAYAYTDLVNLTKQRGRFPLNSSFIKFPIELLQSITTKAQTDIA